MLIYFISFAPTARERREAGGIRKHTRNRVGVVVTFYAHVPALSMLVYTLSIFRHCGIFTHTALCIPSLAFKSV